jgi:hypothetical protein
MVHVVTRHEKGTDENIDQLCDNNMEREAPGGFYYTP